MIPVINVFSVMQMMNGECEYRNITENGVLSSDNIILYTIYT